MAAKKKKIQFDAPAHFLVPVHEKVSDKEKEELLATYSDAIRALPRISMADPGIAGLDVSEGDIIKIKRKSLTAGKTVYYRRVMHG
jgi:DNA-directed RNA polymerase subunit H